MASIISSTFTPVFGQSPRLRYKDIFDQIGSFAEHLSKRHVFADGNKRTTMQVSLALLAVQGVVIDVPDAPSPEENAMYKWIQDIVTGRRSTSELSDFLRRHARPLQPAPPPRPVRPRP